MLHTHTETSFTHRFAPTLFSAIARMVQVNHMSELPLQVVAVAAVAVVFLAMKQKKKNRREEKKRMNKKKKKKKKKKQ